MLESLAGALSLGLEIALMVSPGALLCFAWRDDRARRFGRAATLATLASIASACLLLALAFLTFLLVFHSGVHPAVWAILAVPGLLLYLSRALRTAVDEHRREAIRERRSPATGG